MRARKGIVFGLALLLAAGSATACSSLRTPYEREKMAESGGKAKKAKQQTSTPGRAETVGEKEEREKGQGLLYMANRQMAKMESQEEGKPAKVLEEDPLHLLYNVEMSSEVAKLEGVESATVLLDDEHNAYVALEGGMKAKSDEKSAVQNNDKLNVKTEGEIPKTLQEKIASKIRDIDPLVKTVHITSDPGHVNSFRRYATQLSKGETVNMNTHALAERIQDIWNQ
jgi:hypothetical protein